MPLLRADDNLYYRPTLISFDTDELDTVFGSGPFRPHRPHQAYGIPKRGSDVTVWEQSPWIDLFRRLGVATSPVPADIVAAVKAVRTKNSQPSEAAIQAMRPLYEWVRSNISALDIELLKQLAGLDWLPAKHATAWGWYQPAQVYANKDRSLVGNQAPVLLSFANPNAGLHEQLYFPKEPPVAIVADHLLYLGQQKLSAEPEKLKAIYGFLGGRWDKLDRQRQQSLCQKPVIWYKSRFWEASRTLLVANDAGLSDLHPLFGHRRALLLRRSPDPQDRFFDAVCRAYDPLQSHITLLEEIAAVYATTAPLHIDDHALLIRNFNHLGRQSHDGQTNTTLKSMAIIPGSDKALHRFDSIVLTDSSQPDLLRRFQKTKLVSVADQVQLDASDDTDKPSPDPSKVLPLTEDGFELLRGLGVQLLALGVGVKRELIEAPNAVPHADLTKRLRALSGPFRRIRRTLEDKGGHIASHAESPDLLNSTSFVMCDQLTVQYVVTLPSGATIEAPASIGESLFTRNKAGQPVLYGRDWEGMHAQAALAVDLELVFFPGPGITTSSVIGQLLRCKTILEANTHLSLYQYLSERGEEPPAVDEEEAAESEDSTAYTDGSPEDAEELAEEEPAERAAHPTSATSKSASVATPTGAVHAIREAATSGDTPAAHLGQKSVLPTPSSGAGTTNRAQAQVPPTAASSKVPPQQRGADPKPQPGVTSNKEWVPACAPDKAPLRTRLFQPTQRVVRASHTDDASVADEATTEAQSAAANTAQNQLSQASRQQIGAWGERYVLRHLCATMRKRYHDGDLKETKDGFSITKGRFVVASALWQNEVGYDILLREGQVEDYIEVKATIEQQKAWFQVSGAQWEFARKYGTRYHIYRVFSAGTDNATIQIISNPVACWQDGVLILDPLRVYI